MWKRQKQFTSMPGMIHRRCPWLSVPPGPAEHSLLTHRGRGGQEQGQGPGPELCRNATDFVKTKWGQAEGAVQVSPEEGG